MCNYMEKSGSPKRIWRHGSNTTDKISDMGRLLYSPPFPTLQMTELLTRLFQFSSKSLHLAGKTEKVGTKKKSKA